VLAEAVDFFPTLAALAGLPDPRTVAGSEGINGTSLLPVFEAPEADPSAVKDAAFSQFAKPNDFQVWPTPRTVAPRVSRLSNGSLSALQRLSDGSLLFSGLAHAVPQPDQHHGLLCARGRVAVHRLVRLRQRLHCAGEAL
jgi:hypothetical protein